jgi:hypothetical protein
MDEPRPEELLYRIETLEREKRRWKRISVGTVSILLTFVLLGGFFAVLTAVLIRTEYVSALRAEQELAAQQREQGNRLPLYETDIELAPGRKATFRLTGVKMAITEMEGDYRRDEAKVITNIVGEGRDTVEVHVVPGTKPGNAVLTVKEYLEDKGTAGRVVVRVNIHVKGKGLPTASTTMIEPRRLVQGDRDAREVEVEQGKEVVLDVWQGRPKSATQGRDGLTVLVEGTGGKHGNGFLKITVSKDAKVGEQKIAVHSDEARYPSDEAEAGTTSRGTVEVTVRIKAAP